MTRTYAEKVVAYITHGAKLLVFRHTEYPEAGIQVPAGTVEEGESPHAAVLREAREETGLEGLQVRAFLGMREHDLAPYGRDEALAGARIVRRTFYHLELCGPAPTRWRHYEQYPSDGSPGPIEFEFFWVELPDRVPELSGAQGEMLASLRI